MTYIHRIQSSIKEVTILSRMFKVTKPIFIYETKRSEDYTIKDYVKDTNKSIVFKKHPYILLKMPYYK